MVKIVLPTKNNWLDTYFNTKEAYERNNVNKINHQELETVIKASLGKVPSYTIEFEDRKDGQYFIIETLTTIKWVSLSADYTLNENDGGSTNAYFVQYFPMALRACFEYNTLKRKELELYLKGTSHNRATTDAQILYYRIANTLGVKILNANELRRPEKNIPQEISKKFQSLDDWKRARTSMQSRNTGNKSSYILEEEDSYIFYGKTFGANGRESIFLLCMLAILAKKEEKKIYLYEVNDNGSTSFESPVKEEDKRFKRMLEHMGITYYADAVDYVEQEGVGKTLNEKDKDARHQAEFMRNLMIKFNAERNKDGTIKLDAKGAPIIINTEKKCYLCDCTIQKAIIASHIQRVTDINKLTIPFEEKRQKAIDGDNGFWLCANHDKMFEFGIITFNNVTGRLEMDSENLNDFQKKYLRNITREYGISPEHFTKETAKYLKIHNNRIKEYENIYSYQEVQKELLLVAEEKQEYK